MLDNFSQYEKIGEKFMLTTSVIQKQTEKSPVTLFYHRYCRCAPV